jgi:hypothetical protein
MLRIHMVTSYHAQYMKTLQLLPLVLLVEETQPRQTHIDSLGCEFLLREIWHSQHMAPYCFRFEF